MQARVSLSRAHTHRDDCLDQTNKVGQTEFTVYRHRLFDFACGRAVIIQISN